MVTPKIDTIRRNYAMIKLLLFSIWFVIDVTVYYHMSLFTAEPSKLSIVASIDCWQQQTAGLKRQREQQR
jgi:hypothetical protein